MKKRIIQIIALAIVIVTVMMLVSCASCDRAMSSCTSEVSGGLYRRVDIYAMNGKLLQTFVGKCDFTNSADEADFMFDGTRAISHGGIMIAVEISQSDATKFIAKYGSNTVMWTEYNESEEN